MKRLIVKFCLIFNLWCLKEKLHLHDFLSYLHHQKSDQNDALFLYILPIKGIYLLKGQEGQLTYSISTLLDNLKLYPKIQFSKKIQYCQFWANKQWYWEIFKCHIYLDNLNFRAKIVILCKYRINNNWKLLNFEHFWRENSKTIRNQYVIITIIFGTKFQIHNFVIFSENWIFGHNLRFSNSVIRAITSYFSSISMHQVNTKYNWSQFGLKGGKKVCSSVTKECKMSYLKRRHFGFPLFQWLKDLVRNNKLVLHFHHHTARTYNQKTWAIVVVCED